MENNKLIAGFISEKCPLYNSKTEFNQDLDKVIKELTEDAKLYPGGSGNKHQIAFYKKVKQQLKNK